MGRRERKRKRKKDKLVAFRMTNDDYLKIKSNAQKVDRSFSRELRKMIQRAL